MISKQMLHNTKKVVVDKKKIFLQSVHNKCFYEADSTIVRYRTLVAMPWGRCVHDRTSVLF